MLACELDVPIDIDVPLTILSSVLAVLFTFAALAFDLLWDRFHLGSWQRRQTTEEELARDFSASDCNSDSWEDGAKSHAHIFEQEDEANGDEWERDGLLQDHSIEAGLGSSTPSSSGSDSSSISTRPANRGDPARMSSVLSSTLAATDTSKPSCNCSESRRPSFLLATTHGAHGLANIVNLAHRSTVPAKNAFVTTGEALYQGCTRRNLIKAFLWSLAVSGMHYVGIAALRIPQGYSTLNPFLVVLSGLISWVVCLVGVILMLRIETHLTQQLLFSVVASTGVAAMHFTGMHSSHVFNLRADFSYRGGSGNVLVSRKAFRD